MIESVEIQNFRCFESVSLDDLGLVNVVVGDNSSGKTALLEALYLCATRSSQAHLNFLAWRGSLPAARGPVQVQYSTEKIKSGEFWSDLFHKLDLDKEIQVAIKGSPSRTVKVWVEEQPPDVVVSSGESLVEAPIRFAWRGDEYSEWVETVPKLTQDGTMKMPQAPGSIRGAFLTDVVPAGDLADRYSQLDVKQESEKVEEAICRNFSPLTGLSQQVNPFTGQQALYASVEGLNRKVPLSLVSGGINRATYIVSTIALFGGGSVYIDEFAKGVFHSRIGPLWESVFDIVRETDTQVFLSTHSYEALEALLPRIEGNEEHFRLIRTERSNIGESTVDVIEGESLENAVSKDWEVR